MLPNPFWRPRFAVVLLCVCRIAAIGYMMLLKSYFEINNPVLLSTSEEDDEEDEIVLGAVVALSNVGGASWVVGKYASINLGALSPCAPCVKFGKSIFRR